MLDRQDVLQRLPRAVEALRRCREAAAAYLFGSALDERRDSIRDVDIAVLGTSPLSPARMGELHLSLCAAFETDHVDVVDLGEARLELRHEILATGRLLFETDPERTRQMRERTLHDYLAMRHTIRSYYAYVGENLRRRYAHGAR